MYKRPESRTATIAASGTTSGAIYIADYLAVGIQLPDDLTSTTLTFKGSLTESGDFEDVYDSDGNQVSVAVAANRSVGLSGAEADALAPWPWIKLVCGSAEGSERSILIALK